MKENMELFVDLLAEYISFRSVSTDSAFKSQIMATVDWLTSLFEKNSFEVKILQGPTANPVVFAQHHLSDNAETILVYGHYDVQPAALEDGWDKDPFTLHENNGRLIARGVVDNKGQNLIHVFTVINLIKDGKLKYNIKFMLEGNEETGNADISDLVREYADELKSDYVLISDGQIISGTPTIEASLRGVINLTLTFNSAKNDLHSGLYGGAVPNSLMELVHFLSLIKSKDGKVLIPGFYDSVDEITAKQLNVNAGLQQTTNPIATTGTKILLGDHDFYTQIGLMPTIEFTGIHSGYTGEGYKNIVPGSASVRINFRLVASQSCDYIISLFKEFAAKSTPSYIDYTISIGMIGSPVKVDTDSPIVVKIMELQEEVYGKKPITVACGAGIPIVSDFKQILGADALLVSLSNDDCNMHGVNENFTLDLVEKGLELSCRFFSKE